MDFGRSRRPRIWLSRGRNRLWSVGLGELWSGAAQARPTRFGKPQMVDQGVMATPRTISLDAMGGDEGPGVVVPGAAIALQRHAGVTFLLFGDQARIGPHLERNPLRAERSRIVHTTTVVEMQNKPSQAVRRG